MADVHTDNQREPPMDCTQDKRDISPAAIGDASSDNQLVHDETYAPVVDIDEEDVEHRLTWIGEGLLDGEGLEAVQQLMNLPPSSQKPIQVNATSTETAQEPTVRVERSGSKLLNFLAKEEGYKPDEKPVVATVALPTSSSPRPKPVVRLGDEAKRRNKLLDFLATDIGERYLDGLYQEESSNEDTHNTTPEETSECQAADAAKVQNNRLQAFLARERGERVHDVEKTDADGEPRRPEPYRVSISFATPEAAAEILASDATASAGSPEPTPEVTAAVTPEETVQMSADRNKLVDFVKNMQPPSRPMFVLYTPEDLASISSSGSEAEDASPTGNAKDFRLKRSRQDANRVRYANPGLDIQSGVVRQAVTDHYGREELLDFVADVDMSPALPRSQRSAPQTQRSPSPQELSRRESPPPQRRESPPLHSESPPVRHDSPPLHQDSPSPSATARKPDGRLTTFLRKFSSKSKPGSDSGESRHGSRSNSPDLPVRHSAPPHAPHPQPESSFVPFQRSPFAAHSSVESEPRSATLVDDKSMNQSFGPQSSASDVPSKRTVLLTTLRQLLEDCEANDLSDISMVRISILLSTVNQIVRDDLRKERPTAQGIMRRMTMHTADLEAGAAAGGPTASWVRSRQEQEEYERGHTTTTSDIAHHVERKSPPPTARVQSPLLSLHPVNEPIADDSMTTFTAFETAQNLGEILQSFEKLLGSCGLNETPARPRSPLHVYTHVKSALYNQFSFRQKQLFRLLDAKLSANVYKRQPCLHKRVCVVGAGPVGLRAAVELALLGGQVVVMEKRKSFNRENIVHLWPWVVQDLTSLGAKVLFPQFCHSSAYFHVGTRQLQCILLKVALLLGVQVYPGTTFEAIAAPDAIVNNRKPFYSVVTKPQMPWQEFTAVLGACGTKDKLNNHAGIKRFVFSRKEAIGLVCYFPNLGTNEEKKVNEFSWTIQFKQRVFAKMREMGIDLENVVYYRGEYHYIVMTPKRTNLLQQGVVKINYPSVADLVSVDNIDPGALNDYVSRIINFFEIPQKSEFARVRLFDFSTRTRAAQAANVLVSRNKKLYVGLMGDALMEPFWPEGLGTCRGFLSAMDACWMVAQIGALSDEQILADRELGYRITQHISGFQRDDLQKNVRKYTVDPSSRYTIQYPATIPY